MKFFFFLQDLVTSTSWFCFCCIRIYLFIFSKLYYLFLLLFYVFITQIRIGNLKKKNSWAIIIDCILFPAYIERFYFFPFLDLQPHLFSKNTSEILILIDSLFCFLTKQSVGVACLQILGEFYVYVFHS